MGVEVADGQRLQLVEQILAQLHHGVLGDAHHGAGVDEGAQGAEAEDGAHQHQHFGQTRKVTGQDIVVDQGLEHIAAGDAAHGA